MSKSMCKRRGGWDEMDGRESVVVLYEGRGGRHAGKEIKHYIANKTVCRRKVLFEDFLNYVESDTNVKGCKCCDICSKKCDCDQCTVDMSVLRRRKSRGWFTRLQERLGPGTRLVSLGLAIQLFLEEVQVPLAQLQ